MGEFECELIGDWDTDDQVAFNTKPIGDEKQQRNKWWKNNLHMINIKVIFIFGYKTISNLSLTTPLSTSSSLGLRFSVLDFFA